MLRLGSHGTPLPCAPQPSSEGLRLVPRRHNVPALTARQPLPHLEGAKPVFEIASDETFLFEATVGGEDVGLLHDEMQSRVRFDAYDFQRYGTLAGRVSFIAPDSVVSSDQPSDKGSTYVVRVALDGREIRRGDLCGQIKLGMSGTVEVVTDRRSILWILGRRIPFLGSLG